MHEILTIQLGHQANYLATHFWNTQESYFTYGLEQTPSPVDSNILFRAGINESREETYTPRTVIYDLKGGFGGLRKWGGLYDQQLSMREGDAQDRGSAWGGTVALHQDPPILPAEYQRSLEENESSQSKLTVDTVRYWSDYNRMFYHPRSIVQLSECDFGSSLSPLERYESGEELFRNIDRDDDLLDRDMRPMLEECDQVQAIQLLTAQTGAWAGFGATYTERLRDEFGKLGLWVWGIADTRGKLQRSRQVSESMDEARMLGEMSANASMYVPLSVPAAGLPPYVQLNRDSRWHTSALLSAAFESITLPARQHSAGSGQTGLDRLDRLEASLNTNGHQCLARLQASVSIADYSTQQEPDQSTDLDLDLSTNLRDLSSAKSSRSYNTVFGGIECFRGRPYDSNDTMLEANQSMTMQGHSLSGSRNMTRFVSSQAYPLIDSFPPIFFGLSNGSVDIVSSLTTSSKVAREVKSLRTKINSAVGASERDDLIDSLSNIVNGYEEGWSSGSGEDSDE